MSIRVTGVEMTVLYDTQVIAEVKNNTVVHIPMRSDSLYFINIDISLDKNNQMGYMA